MEEYEKIFKEVLAYIKPKPEEREKLNKIAKKVLEIANEEAKKIQGRAILAGSVTRDTWLADKMEFDIFLLLPPSLPEKKLEEFGLTIGKEIIERVKGKYKIEYAQHPYVSGEVRGVRVDIVPCYEVKSPEKIKSAVDRTPFHVKYVEKNLTTQMSNEVRLLKQFLKANGIYGADAKTQGFSGYLCELLIIYYKKFIELLKNCVNWKPGEIIDLEGFYKVSEYPKLRKKFKEEALIVIDPVDRNRNVAAAVSSENLYIFKKIAKEFLINPSGKLFFQKEIKPLEENELILNQIKRRTEIILLKFKAPKVVPDILWPQLRRSAERLEKILRENEFVVLRKDVYTDEKENAIILFEMEVSKLPFVQKRVGPKIFDLDDSERFLKKYKGEALVGPFIENNKWCFEVKRKFLTAREKLFDSLNKDVKILKAKGIPNYVAEEISKNFEIICENEKIMEIAKKDKNFGIFLRKYFEKESLI
ncbi:MAG: CCA tRNA nucleotidyltransferase [Candidatus Aenigmatarchaeota archaeon]